MLSRYFGRFFIKLSTMDIKEFTPTEVLMLTSPFGVSGKNLTKYAFLDLVFNNYLIVYQDYRQSHPRDPHERLYTLVSRGERFE